MSAVASSVFLAPRWVLVGVEFNEGGVVIVASDKLGRMEVEAIRGEFASLDWPPSFSRVVGYRIEGSMERFTIATGATWREAFINLMGAWSPEGDVPLLPIGEVQAIEGGMSG